MSEPNENIPAPTIVVPTTAAPPKARRRRWVWPVAIVVAVLLLAAAVPWVIDMMGTVSTDDAYVSGHVTFVAPRVGGQVARVLVDDNNRVRKGDLLVQLDKEPYEVQVKIAQSAVDTAQANLTVAEAQVRGIEGQARSLRYGLQHAIEDVDNQISLLRSKAATLNSQKATLAKTQADYERAMPLVEAGGVTKEELDRRKEAMLVAQSQVEQALQGVYQVRVALGLPPKPETSDDLTAVPADLDQSFSSVRQAQYALLQAAAQLGVIQPFNQTPKEMLEAFYKRDPQGDIDRIYAQLLKDAPAVKQAQSKLAEAQRNLDQANLNLKYCDVVSEIDGVVTRRDVNPGNNVVAGQSLMAVRSISEIWIDANFKETQLRDLRLGLPVDIDVDMYGGKHQFKGRITGFTMGTGSTLSLLPAQNATGNFVKVVQRLPVRIDLVDYDSEKSPLFIGLSATPKVRIHEEPTGPNAGALLQPLAPTTPPGTNP